MEGHSSKELSAISLLSQGMPELKEFLPKLFFTKTILPISRIVSLKGKEAPQDRVQLII